MGGAALALAEAAGLEGAAFGSFLPLSNDVATALDGNARVTQALDSGHALLLGALALASPSGGSARSIVLTSEVEIHAFPSAVPGVAEALSIGFLDPLVSGNGFEPATAIARNAPDLT